MHPLLILGLVALIVATAIVVTPNPSKTSFSTFVIDWPRRPTYSTDKLYATPIGIINAVEDAQKYDYYSVQGMQDIVTKFPKIPVDQNSSFYYFVPMGI
jgi:hypothetical protein